jgi:small subunit ribosomal protein S4e
MRADVIHIAKTDEYFRLLYDSKGRFVTHRITAEEGKVRIEFGRWYSSVQ